MNLTEHTRLLLILIFSAMACVSAAESDESDSAPALQLYIEGEGEVSVTEVSPKDTVYERGSVIELTPIASEGWFFAQWFGDLTGSEQPAQLTMDRRKNIVAAFASYYKAFGGSGGDDTYSVTATSDGGVVLTGTTNSTDGDFTGNALPMQSLFILKLTDQLTTDWIRFYGGPGRDVGYAVQETSDGGFIITGMTDSNGGAFSSIGYFSPFILKVSGEGTFEWATTIGGSDRDVAHSVTETNSGDYLITGVFESGDGTFSEYSPERQDVFVVKLNSVGEEQWSRSVGSSLSEQGISVIQANSGEYVITGTANGSRDGDFAGISPGGMDVFVLRMDQDGNILSLNTYGDSSAEGVESVALNSNGDLIIAGNTNSDGSSTDQSDIFLMTVGAGGELISHQTIGGSGDDVVNSVLLDSDGNIAVSGYTDSNDGLFEGLQIGSYDLFLAQFDPSGILNWVKTFGGSNSEEGSILSENLAETTDGKYVLTGRTNSTGGNLFGLEVAGRSEILVIPVDKNGEIIPLFSAEL